MKKWYSSITPGQKAFLFILALIATPFMAGIPFLLLLIYLQLGNTPDKTNP